MIERIESSHEKKLNYLTHGFGLILSIVGLFLLIEKSLGYESNKKLISSIIYGLSLVVMYASSSFYHYYIDSKYSSILQKIDHVSIYLLIAGSYTPALILKLG